MSFEEPRPRSRECTIIITIDDAGDRTRAIARMDWRDRSLVGVGQTRPSEQFPDRLSENLSVSRALADLSVRLRTCPAHAVETATSHSAAAP